MGMTSANVSFFSAVIIVIPCNQDLGGLNHRYAQHYGRGPTREPREPTLCIFLVWIFCIHRTSNIKIDDPKKESGPKCVLYKCFMRSDLQESWLERRRDNIKFRGSPRIEIPFNSRQPQRFKLDLPCHATLSRKGLDR